MSTNTKILLFVFVIGILELSFSDINPLFNGYGIDGLHYGHFAQNIPDNVLSAKEYFEEPWFQRIVPSAIVHYGLKITGVSLEPDRSVHYYKISENVVTGFQIMNFLLFLLTGWIMLKILDVLQVRDELKWLAFIGLFINYACLKHYWFEPVMTDQFALFLGSLTLYGFLLRKHWLLFFLLIVSYYSWPPATYYCGILLILPRPKNGSISLGDSNMSKITALFMLTVILAIIIYIQYVFPLCRYEIENVTVDFLVPLSTVFVLVYFFMGSRLLLMDRSFFSIRKWYSELNIWNLILVILLTFILIVSLDQFNANPEIMCDGKEYNLYNFILYNIRLAISRPFGFFVSHVHFFGPIILISLFFWKSISKVIRQFGIGLTLFFLINLFFSLNSETRQLTWSLPFIIVFTVKGLEDYNWKPVYNWVIFGIGLIYSKIWLPLIPRGMNDEVISFIEAAIFTEAAEKISFEFPIQRINMNYGPWMNDGMFLIHAFIMIVTAYILYKKLISKIQKVDQ